MSRILLIDGNDEPRQMLMRLLKTAGYEAVDGGSGIALYGKALPRLVIIAIQTPGKDGIETVMILETIVVLRRAHPGLKILAVSGGGRSNATVFLAIARILGADETLQRPFRNTELLKIVVRLLGSEHGGLQDFSAPPSR